MNVVGILPSSRDTTIKILQAISVGDFAQLYPILRGVDKNMAFDFQRTVAQSNLTGKDEALKQMAKIDDPYTRVRTGAVYLLLAGIEGQD